jgi:hypothetical protein
MFAAIVHAAALFGSHEVDNARFGATPLRGESSRSVIFREVLSWSVQPWQSRFSAALRGRGLWGAH